MFPGHDWDLSVNAHLNGACSYFSQSHPKEKTMKIRPLQDRLIVKRRTADDKVGSLFVPETAKEKPVEGEVLAVGNGKLLESGALRPLDISAGDVVLFGKYAGTEIKVDGEDLVMLREEDVLGVLEK